MSDLVSNLPPRWQAPRAQLLVQGAPITGLMSAETEENNSYQIDTFKADVALGTNVAETLAWWGALFSYAPIQCELQIAYLDETGTLGGWSSAFIGVLDEFEHDPEGGTISLSGRSLAARLKDAQTAETFQNQTATQIVTTLATRRNLTPNVSAPNNTAGQFYTADHTASSLTDGGKRTEWDVLTALAQEQDCALYVTGNDLYFQPVQTDSDTPWYVIYQPQPLAANVGRPKVRRSAYWSRPIVVNVASHHPKTGATGTVTAQAPGFGDTLEFNFTKSAWQTDRMQTWANQKLAKLLMQRAGLDFVTLYDPTLTPRSIVQASGFGPPFDTTYFVQKLTNSFKPSGCLSTATCTLSNPLDGEIADASGDS